MKRYSAALIRDPDHPINYNKLAAGLWDPDHGEIDPSQPTHPPAYNARKWFLCVEPNLQLDAIGVLVTEEQVLVTESGHRLLSRRAPFRNPVLTS